MAGFGDFVATRVLPAVLLWGVTGVLLFAVVPAHALSEIQREELPPPAIDGESEPAPPPPVPSVPLPDPIVPPRADTPEPEDDLAAPAIDPDEPLPEIRYDTDQLPEPVQRMRARILEACLSGDVEQLRPLIGIEPNATQLSFSGVERDPVELLRELSGDDEGQEILAILYEVLTAGYVHLEPGTSEELFVWPYFFAVPLDRLDARQRVELFMLVTAGDYEDMKAYGAYIFYRVGITPDGRWQFFVAGD